VITEAELTLEEAERAEPLLDLYDAWSAVIWTYAKARTASESEARGVVVDAFGTAAQNQAFFDGPVSPIGRLLMLIDGIVRSAESIQAASRHRRPLPSTDRKAS
jgi:hypothetical protein